MAKTVPPGEITVASGQTFAANVLPDPFDARDLEYRPRLQPLPGRIDQRSKASVLSQVGSSCTGHAVAAMVNTILSQSAAQGVPGARVSPYMLYRLARRYDEFPGEADAGSSLRGVFKGWFNHGIVLEASWPRLDMEIEPDLTAESLIAEARDRPLGAFYRVSPYRLDDLQSAISELFCVAVSGVIHSGWEQPAEVIDPSTGETMHVIQRSLTANALGGHAYALVGYNKVGFLVQNSWGSDWGKGGFATLPYDEWLDSAYDAWVARPGVPQTPFAVGRTRTAAGTEGELVTAPGPDLRRLRAHAVNLANDGRLSESGKFASSPAQVEEAFAHMALWHDRWAAEGDPVPRVVLYAHGGVVGEAAGLAIAQQQLNWWLNNHVYPLFFVWESGPLETLGNVIADHFRTLLPFRAAGFDLLEAVDRFVEGRSRDNFWWMWSEMKENASKASDPIPKRAKLQWPPRSSATIDSMAAMPGGSLVVDRLRRYAGDRPQLEVHMVGHSAGTILLCALLERLNDARMHAASMAFMGAALRADLFENEVLGRLGKRKLVRSLAHFVLAENVELDDTCKVGDFTFYNKSLLYLVARGFERPGPRAHREVPIAGLRASLQRAAPDGSTLEQRIAAAGGAVVVAPTSTPADARSEARGHGEFDNDPATMTSVLRRILASRANTATTYAPHAPLLPPPAREAISTEVAGTEAVPQDQPFIAASVQPGGQESVVETAPDRDVSAMPPPEQHGWALEAADAPQTGSPVLDLLQGQGMEVADPGAQ